MYLIIVKYLVTAGIVVLISEIAKRNDKFGALIAGLPIVTLLVMTWLHLEKQPMEKIGNHAYYTFFYVIPTLPMFLIFPFLLTRVGFWYTMLLSIVITIISFFIFAFITNKFGIKLL
jgi:hypothetical protein